jgi:putative flippase GtrA
MAIHRRPPESLIRFVAVGGAIGVLSLGGVWLIGQVASLGPVAYACSVAAIYFVGAICSFFAHARISFRVAVPMSRFPRHLAVCLGAAILTGLLSSAIRAFLPSDVLGVTLDEGLRDAAAFVIAALAMAVVSYLLSRAYVFQAPDTSRL